jgi:hypothetical protein
MSAVQNATHSNSEARWAAGEHRAASQRAARSLRRALSDADVRQCVSDALSLDALSRSADAPLRAAFEVLVRDASDRAPWGLDDPAAVVADLSDWALRGDLDPAMAFAVAATVLGETHAHRNARPVAMVAIEEPHDTARALADVFDHRLADAEARARRITRDFSAREVMREVFVPALAPSLAALGDAAAQVVRGWCLAERFPDAAEDVMAATAVMLTVTHSCVRSGGGFDPVDGASLVVKGDPRASLLSCARLVANGLRAASTSPRDVAHHDVSRALRMVHAALVLLPLCDEARAAELVAQCVGAVDRLPIAAEPLSSSSRSTLSLEEALESRDLAVARAAAANVSPADVFHRLCPFAASVSAVRPYQIAIAVQSVEALRWLSVEDPTHAATYADAALAMTVPWRVERSLARTIDDLRAR